MTIDPSQSIEHQNIPQAHQGLHDFLYSSEDEHSASPATHTIPEGKAETPLPLSDWLVQIQDGKVAGVYAVLDCDLNPQYIGYSRNVTLALKTHLTQQGEQICAFVKVHPFKFPKRAEMEQLRDDWLAALPSPPPGNAQAQAAWTEARGEAAVQAMSEAERQAYEEKNRNKIKKSIEKSGKDTKSFDLFPIFIITFLNPIKLVAAMNTTRRTFSS
ncbi:MAG: GIY-YIG nuclease family protein [Acaryochloridaceae cyanobacterium SU_2_1]|nr:GIY-YIG nuclease family protein [Acaryochloridaceae cyanobacterium SU_2_1]